MGSSELKPRFISRKLEQGAAGAGRDAARGKHWNAAVEALQSPSLETLQGVSCYRPSKVAENDAPHTCFWMTNLIEFLGTTSDTDTPKVIRPVLWWTQDRNIMARERLNAPVQNTTIPNTLSGPHIALCCFT